MACRRCSGLLVPETFDSLREETARLYPATRCINCGSIEDSVVRANRLRPPAAPRSKPHEMFRNGGVLFLTARAKGWDAL